MTRPIRARVNALTRAGRASCLRTGLAGGLLALGLGSAPAGAAITFVQTIGTTQDKTLGTSIAVTVPAAGVSAGHSVVLTFSMLDAAGTVSAADSKGNTYTVDANVSNAGNVRTVILANHNVTALASGDTITITHPSSSARALGAYEFAGLKVSSVLDKTSTNTGSGTDADSNATPPIAQADELLIGAVGINGPVDDTFTPDINWTALARDGTTGGGTSSNATINPAYRIVSAIFSYRIMGTNSGSRQWGAAIATYRGLLCGDGIVSGSEQCDEGVGVNGSSGSCCTATCTLRAAGQTCRPAADGCDAVETCTGASPTCPADAVAGAGTSCPDDGNPCTTDTCDGVSSACQHAAGNAGAVCRPVAGSCDVAETCDGSSTCPSDVVVAAGTECRAAARARTPRSIPRTGS